jgi:AraC-like DNA-binding protein
MPSPRELKVPLNQLLQPRGAGLCLSRGNRLHPDRQIGEHEIIFVRRGRLGIAEQDRGLDPTAGEAILLWPQRRHYGTEVVAAGSEFYWLHVLVPPAREGEPTLSVPQRCRPARPIRLMELLHQYLSDQASGRLTQVAGSALVQLMFSEMSEQHADAGGVAADATLAARAEAEIARRFHLSIGTASIARQLRCNPDYLGRIYHRSYGRTVMRGIAERRVEEARRLLMECPGMPIATVCHQVGFRNHAWFRRIFSRIAGSTPDLYRRRHARTTLNS